MITLSHALCVFTFVALSAIHVECENDEIYRFIQLESPKWYKFEPTADVKTSAEPTKSSQVMGSGEEKTTPNATMEPVEPTTEIPMCSQEMDQGNGVEMMYRYFYNATTNECEEFVYQGGADENKNRFYTLDQCMDACVLTEKDMRDAGRTLSIFSPDYCLLDMDEGFGRARVRRFYYNSTLNRCVGFIFAGFGGNMNRFHERHQCMDVCFEEMKRMDCQFDVQMVNTCRQTSKMNRIASCATRLFNVSRESCAEAGCCWHHSLRICYRYSSRRVRGNCRILAESKDNFIGVANFQSPIRSRRGWVGSLIFTKPNTGSFCVLKHNFTPKITVGIRLFEDRLILLEERGRVPKGHRTDFLFTGTYGQVTINPSVCVGEISQSDRNP